MNRSNVMVLFYLKPSSKKADKASVYVRFTIDGVRKVLSINRAVFKEDWDYKRQRPIRRHKTF